MFKLLQEINQRPAPFEVYTAEELWTDEYTAGKMLEYHLNDDIEASSRNSGFIDRSVGWIADRFQLGSGSRVADFGCGPGLYASRLAKAGARVTGIDFSENSLQYARNKAAEDGLDIDCIRANYLDFETEERFDLIIMIMCDFCALSPEQREKLLQKFYKFLKPGGHVLLDVYTLKSFAEKSESASYELNQLFGFWSADDYYCFVNTFKYDDECVVLDKYTIISEDQTKVVYNWLQHFSENVLRGEFEHCGFSVEDLYANVAGDVFAPDGGEMAIVAVKPE